MPDSQIGGRREERQRDQGEDLRTRRRTERRNAKLKSGRMLAVGEIGTRQMPLVLVKQMVNQMGGEREEIHEEDRGSQGAQR